LDTKASAPASNRCNTSIPAGDFRFSVTDSLPRFAQTKWAAMPFTTSS
jgi:hypothetical protein